jgi:hypothetical protein
MELFKASKPGYRLTEEAWRPIVQALEVVPRRPRPQPATITCADCHRFFCKHLGFTRNLLGP